MRPGLQSRSLLSAFTSFGKSLSYKHWRVPLAHIFAAPHQYLSLNYAFDSPPSTTVLRTSRRRSLSKFPLRMVKVKLIAFQARRFPALSVSMAYALPKLPAELLLHVIDSCDPEWLSNQAFKNLRATCRGMNDELMYFFGVKYFQNITIRLQRSLMENFQTISSGHLGAHINKIHIHTSDLIEQSDQDTDLDSTDETQLSWYGRDTRNIFTSDTLASSLTRRSWNMLSPVISRPRSANPWTTQQT